MVVLCFLFLFFFVLSVAVYFGELWIILLMRLVWDMLREYIDYLYPIIKYTFYDAIQDV